MSDTIEIILLAKDEASKTITGVRGALGGLGSAMGMAGTAIIGGALAAGGAITAFGVSSVGVARDFESAMAVMSTAVDPAALGVASAAEAMEIMGQAALAVGSDTALVGVSASGAADSITGLYKAGLSTGEIFGDLQGYLAGTAELGGALRASVDLAAASELDMVAASELAAVTLATFGGELTTTEERAAFVEAAMNNFVQTADGSVASVGDLAAAMVNVGSTMASFGIPLEDVNTALGVLSTRGITGADAGTALKSMFLNMMNAPGAAKALGNLNVELYDMEGNLKPMPAIIGEIEGAMAGMTQEQRDQIAVQLAGNYGIKAFNALLGEGAAGWDDMSTAIGNAATMQETAAARANTFEGAMEGLSGVMETLKISVGLPLIQEVLTPLARLFADLATQYGPQLTAMFETIAGGIGRLIAIVAEGGLADMFTIFEDGSSILESLFEAFGMSETAARSLATGIIEFVTTITDALKPVTSFIAEFVSWKDVLIAVGAIIAAALIPAIVSIITAIAPVLLAIGAVIAIVALLRNAWENNWGGIQDKTKAVWAFLQPILAQVVEWVGTRVREGLEKLRDFWVNVAWPAIQSAVQTAWPIIQNVLTAIGDFIKNTLIPAIQALWQKWVNDVWPAIQSALQNAWAVIEPILQKIGAFITDTLIPKIQELWNKWVNEIWPDIQTALQNAWTIIEEIFTEVGRWINDNIVPWIEFLKRIWVEEVWPAIQGALEDAWAIIEPIWTSIKDWLDVVIPPILDFFKRKFEEVMSAIQSAIGPVKEVWDGLVGAIQGFWDWLTGKVFTFNFKLPDLPDWAIPGSPLPIHTAWRNFADDMADIGQKIAAGFLTAFGGLENEVEKLEEILGAAGGLSGLGSNFASIFEQQAIAPIQQALDALSPELEGLTGSLEGVFANLSERFGYEVTMNDPGIEALLKRVAWEGQQYSDPARKEAGRLAELALAQLEARNILLFEQSELQKKLELQQEKMMQLEMQRQQLGFLQEQFNLIKLINENGLDASILDGLDFGLNADPAALMNAMIAATQEMINAANAELDTNPPYAPKTSLANDFFAGVGTMGGGGTVVNIDARRADRGAAEDIRRVVVQVLNEYGIRADIRMRTT